MVPRESMPQVLKVISLGMPVTYAVDAMQAFGGAAELNAFSEGNIVIDAVVLSVFYVVLLGFASLSLQRVRRRKTARREAGSG